MLTAEIRNQIDRIWDAFWSGGISNPLEVIEQITYLLFIRRLDDLQTLAENKAAHVHHMRYALTLVGEGPPDFYEGFFLRGWQPLTQRRLGKTELRFGFDSLRDAPK